MIAYVEGRVAEITNNACLLVTAGGVGYEIYLSAHALAQLPPKGEQTFLYTSTIVREDALELFGFNTWDERETFLTLIGINRVGPRTALAMLGIYRPEDLRGIVLAEDVSALARVPGIGKKTAQQIFLELKFKLKLDGASPGQSAGLPAAGGVFKDALAALLNLGYDEDEAGQVVKEVLSGKPDLDLSAALRSSLRKLAR